MKQTAFIIIFILMLSKLSIAQRDLTIEGKTPDSYNGALVMISSFFPRNFVFEYPKIEMKVTVLNQKFKFRINCVSAELYLIKIRLNAGKELQRIFLFEPGKADLQITDSLFNNVNIYKNETAQDFLRFQQLIVVPSELLRLKIQWDSAKVKADTVSIKQIRNKMDSMNSVMKENFAFSAKSWLSGNPLSRINTFVIKDYMVGFFPSDSIIKMFAKLPAKTKLNSYGKELQYLLMKVNVGDVLSDFYLYDTSGKSVSLKDFKGTYVLLDFWASWCKPCRDESVDLFNLYYLYKNKKFEIVSISLDKHINPWKDAVIRDRRQWSNISDLKEYDGIAKEYAIRSIPSNFLINKEGIIIGKNLDIAGLNKVLEKELH